MRFRHFAIQNERSVSIEFLLQFVQLLVAARPWARFVHYQQHIAAFLVDREQVNYGGIGNADLRFCHAIVKGLNAIDFAR